MFLIIFSIWTIIPVNSESSDAISYQSYKRYDVPLSYEFTSLHKHDIPKRNINNIQYAPLIIKPKDDASKGIPTTQTIQDNYVVTKKIEMLRSNLEPRDSQEIVNYRPQQISSYVPGYNYQLKSPRVVEDERIYNENNYNNDGHSQYLLNYKKPEVEYKTLTTLPHSENLKNFPIAQNVPHEIKHVDVSKHNEVYEYSNDNRNINTLPALENDNIQPYMVVKAPRLHLNVARAYRFIQSSHKAPTEINDLKSKMNDRKTYLQPVQNKHVHILHRVR